MIPFGVLQISNVDNLPDKEAQSDGSKMKTLKRPWTEAEDELIRRLVDEFGPKNWTKIAKYVPDRQGKQCRERWFNHLDPTINKG